MAALLGYDLHTRQLTHLSAFFCHTRLLHQKKEIAVSLSTLKKRCPDQGVSRTPADIPPSWRWMLSLLITVTFKIIITFADAKLSTQLYDYNLVSKSLIWFPDLATRNTYKYNGEAEVSHLICVTFCLKKQYTGILIYFFSPVNSSPF